MAGHIPRRDSASNAKELDTAKKENRKLKRELSKLQKYVAKLLDQSEMFPDPEMNEEIKLPPVEGAQCPTCQGPLSIVNLGTKTLKACKSCGWRKVV